MSNSTITFLAGTDPLVSVSAGDSNVQIQLRNDTATPLQFYWVDSTGHQNLFQTIQAGQSFNQISAQSQNVWLVTNGSGISFKFQPTALGIIDVTPTGPTFIPETNQMITTAQGAFSTWNGYGVVNAALSLGVADNAAALPINTRSNNLELNLIHAPAAWAAGFTGKGVVVAEIDSGVAANAEINSHVIGSYNAADGSSNAAPTPGTSYVGHGLGVSAIIAGTATPDSTGAFTTGVAPDAKLLAVNVNGPSGITDQNIAAGIQWSVDHGAKVLCIPINSSNAGVSDTITNALQYAHDHNVVSVVIGGNFSNYGPTWMATAAAKGLCIDVGNLNVTSDTPFQSSNMAGAAPLNWVMAASSGYVPNPDGGFTYYSDGGTSFAGPYVAGLAALLEQQSPNATADQIYQKIIAGAVANTAAANGTAATTGNSPPTTLTATGPNTVFTHIVTGGGFTGQHAGDLDTVVYSGVASGYSVQHVGDHYTVTDLTTHTVDTVANIDHLQFSDVSVALNTGGSAGELFRLYETVFGRAPDAGGFGYWLNAVEHGTTVANVAQTFLGTKEAASLYGGDNTTFVKELYTNMLHRTADDSGLQYWVTQLQGGASRGAELLNFSDSAENVVKFAGQMDNGITYIPFHG